MDEIIEAIGWSLESGTTYRKYNLIVRMASKTHHMVQMKLLTGGRKDEGGYMEVLVTKVEPQLNHIGFLMDGALMDAAGSHNHYIMGTF
jgi:hypothetical protein